MNTDYEDSDITLQVMCTYHIHENRQEVCWFAAFFQSLQLLIWLEELLWSVNQWWQVNCYHSCQIVYFLQHDRCEHNSSLLSHQDRLKLDWVEVNVWSSWA